MFYIKIQIAGQMVYCQTLVACKDKKRTLNRYRIFLNKNGKCTVKV